MERFRYWLAYLIAPDPVWIVKTIEIVGREVVLMKTEGNVLRVFTKAQDRNIVKAEYFKKAPNRAQ